MWRYDIDLTYNKLHHNTLFRVHRQYGHYVKIQNSFLLSQFPFANRPKINRKKSRDLFLKHSSLKNLHSKSSWRCFFEVFLFGESHWKIFQKPFLLLQCTSCFVNVEIKLFISVFSHVFLLCLHTLNKSSAKKEKKKKRNTVECPMFHENIEYCNIIFFAIILQPGEKYVKKVSYPFYIFRTF